MTRHDVWQDAVAELAAEKIIEIVLRPSDRPTFVRDFFLERNTGRSGDWKQREKQKPRRKRGRT